MASYEIMPRPDDFGIALFSRIPLDPFIVAYYGQSSVPSVHAELTLNGRHLSLLN